MKNERLTGIPGPGRRNWAGLLECSVRRQIGLLLLVAGFAVAGWIAGRWTGLSLFSAIRLYLPTYLHILPLSIGLLLIGRGAWIGLVDRPARPLTALAREIRDRLATRERVATALPVLLAMPFFAGAFTLFKSLVGHVEPFGWDAAFARWDALLHAGFAPWELLQPVLGHPPVTWLINWIYNVWYFVFSLVWIWQAFSLRDRTLRLQFFYALLLGWILLGCIAALVFASAGPCFFGAVVDGENPYLPLIDYLRIADQHYDIWALTAQDMLWGSFETKQMQLGSGISAMPSMHIAMAFLFFLVGRRVSRWLGRVLFVYFLLILIGSVHLAWHYAIDGYASVLAMIPIWLLSGRLAALTQARIDAGLPPAPVSATSP